jgi:hypothetical protein
MLFIIFTSGYSTASWSNKRAKLHKFPLFPTEVQTPEKKTKILTTLILLCWRWKQIWGIHQEFTEPSAMIKTASVKYYYGLSGRMINKQRFLFGSFHGKIFSLQETLRQKWHTMIKEWTVWLCIRNCVNTQMPYYTWTQLQSCTSSTEQCNVFVIWFL